MNGKSDVVSDVEAKALAFRSSWKQTVLELVILAVSGICMNFAYPGWNLAGFAWFSVVPLFWIVRRKTMLRACLYGFFFGYVWNLCGCFWLREIQFAIPFAFAAVLGAFTGLWTLVIPFFSNQLLYPVELRVRGGEEAQKFFRFPAFGELAVAFSMAFWWVILEWVRTWIFTGFPWNLLGASQWQNLVMIQIAEYTGIYGVSFLVILMNISLFFAIHGLKNSLAAGKYKRPFPLIVSIVLMILCISFGRSRVERYVTFRGPYQKSQLTYVGVGVVQPTLSLRRNGNTSLSEEALDVCVRLTRKLMSEDVITSSSMKQGFSDMRTNAAKEDDAFQRALQSRQTLAGEIPVQMIVWPETAVPVPYRGGFEICNRYRQNMMSLLDEYKIPMIIGTIDFGEVRSQSDFDVYNCAMLLTPDKKSSFGCTDRYSKVHIVPFGEFVPLARFFPFLQEWIGMGRSLTPGASFNPLNPLSSVRAGVMICYEDVFAYVARGHALNGANMLLVITNDAWYPTSFEPEQHYANSVFRAIETRLPMLRCGNMNYSVLFDPAGQPIDTIHKRNDPQGNEILMPEVKVPGASKILVPIQANHKPTFYTLYGNVFVLACGIGGFLIFLIALFRWKAVNSEAMRSMEDAREAFRKSMEH